MSILLDGDTRVLVQGITGSEGGFHTRRMIEYGTNVVGGVTPGKGGSTFEGLPVFDSVAEASSALEVDATVSFVPAQFGADPVYEAVDAGIALVVCISEGVPAHEMLKAYAYVKGAGAVMIGPNCPGLISPGKAKMGILPGQIFQAGKVGIVSRSGTLTYEIADQLSRAGIGQSTVVGIGGDPVVGSSFIDIVDLFNRDEETEIVVLVGEIGGSDEEEAARFIAEEVGKPVVGYIAGFSAPPGKRMGHAGAIISGSSGEGSAEAKANVLEETGIPVARMPKDVVRLVKEKMSKVSV